MATSLLRADPGETALEIDIIPKKWGGFAFSSLSAMPPALLSFKARSLGFEQSIESIGWIKIFSA